ncbi:MAG: CHAD domain-containing protein [Thermodesulfobacteriota bacterium]
MNPAKEASGDKSEYFVLSSPGDREVILAGIGSNLTLAPDSSRDMERVFLDTFDHRLYRNGQLLSKEGERYVLRSSGTEMDLSSPYSDTDGRPRFWQDFPDGPFREALRQVIDIRALVPQVSIRSAATRHNVVNEDEKTVVHLAFEEIEVAENGSGKVTVHLLEAAPVRGYADEFDDIIRRLAGMGIERADGNIFSIALGAVGKTAGDYSSKVTVRLEPDMPSGDALKMILGSLLETMRKNEEGIIKDIDTEFLHDFRVAVRRTRSALTLIRGIFPESVKEEFKTEFAAIGRKSNELRDLDIYLLRRERYTEMLPPALRPGLGPLYDIIAREREEAHEGFVSELASGSYRRSIEAWGKFLNEPAGAEDELPDSGAPVIDLAKKRIRKRYRKAVKLGKDLDESSPDRDFHTLRIECKKLRYYLEFFESLFPADEIKAAIRHLKQLQDNLGDYNDMHVQQERLKGYISKMDPAAEEGRDSIAAAGGLISELYLKQKELRAEFHARFEEFSGDDMKALFEKLFSGN